jgi:hypothetical protein
MESTEIMHNETEDPEPNFSSEVVTAITAVSSVIITPESTSARKKVFSKHKMSEKPLTLASFYPEVTVEEKVTAITRKKKKKESSRTKQLLLNALADSKIKLSHLLEKEPSQMSSIVRKSRRLINKERKEREKERTINLSNFIPMKTLSETKATGKISELSVKNEEDKVSESRPIIRSQIPVMGETDQFPFTTLAEWLIWHTNFPELAFVREAYDLDAVPSDSDEIYWINVMNEPEFFNSNWKMAGSIIHDLNQARRQGPPTSIPDFNLDFNLTEGFSTLFMDIYLILTKMPNGLKNHQYPVVQLALKGLFLLDLIFMDHGKWFAKESEEVVNDRVKELDRFMLLQETEENYKEEVELLFESGEWQEGIVYFDLLISKSLYLSTFSQTHITEEAKLVGLKKLRNSKKIQIQLNKIEFLDERRVNVLLSKFS